MKGDIEIISSTGKGMCGGTDAYIDWSLPKVISSEDMIFFKAESALNAPDRAERNIEPLGFVSTFAAPCGGGTFLFHEYGRGFSRYDERIFSLSLVKENVFPALCALVKRLDLAKDNGFHSKTHGLPENFGGSIDIKYSSGEKISISNNQSPVLSREAGFEISQFFIGAMKGEKVALPDAKDLAVIRFDEERSDGGFTRVALTLNADGTGTNKRSSRYDAPTVFKSERSVSAETVQNINKTIETAGLFAWEHLPEKSYSSNKNKTLTFVFRNGQELTVRADRAVPERIGGAFFDIELELATKN